VLFLRNPYVLLLLVQRVCGTTTRQRRGMAMFVLYDTINVDDASSFPSQPEYEQIVFGAAQVV
jgi:hypothetical protein